MPGAKTASKRLSPVVRNTRVTGLLSWTASSNAKAGVTAQVCRRSSVCDNLERNLLLQVAKRRSRKYLDAIT